MWELQLQHCAVLQTHEDARFDGDEALVDGGRGELLFGKRSAIHAAQGVQQSAGAPFEAAEGVCLVDHVRASANQYLTAYCQDGAGSHGDVVLPDYPVIGRSTAITTVVAPFLPFRWFLGLTVEAEHGEPIFAGNVKLEVTRTLTVTNTIGVLGIEG